METLNTQLHDNATATATEEARRAGVVSEMNELEKSSPFQIETPAPKSANMEKLEAKRAELERLKARGYTSIHPEVEAAEKEIAQLRAVVAGEKPAVATRTQTPAGLRYTTLKAELEAIDRRLASLRSQRAPINAQLTEFNRRVDSTPRHEGALAQLTREYGIARDQLEDQLTRQSVARQHDQIERIDHSVVFRVVEPAKAPLDPYFPNRLYLVLIGLGSAIGLGLGLVLLVESSDSSFKDVEDLQAKSGLPVLTMVPRINKMTRKKRTEVNKGLTAQGITANPEDTVVPLVDPKSVPAEQYQILATRLRRRMKPDTGLVVMLTSSAGGEGKTLTSVNLATCLAASGNSVLLIDADLRRPRVHQYLGLRSNEGQGLGALIAMPEGDISKVATKVGGLTVLCSKHPVANPLNVLGSPKLPVLIERLRTQFQFIIIDSPPVMPLADGMVLDNLADRVVVVVRAYQTTQAVLRRALEALDSEKLTGVILNDVNMKHSKYSYVYRYYENTYLRGA
jgi:capsular exopolysaccharide synthesis family protein